MKCIVLHTIYSIYRTETNCSTLINFQVSDSIIIERPIKQPEGFKINHKNLELFCGYAVDKNKKIQKIIVVNSCYHFISILVHNDFCSPEFSVLVCNSFCVR